MGKILKTINLVIDAIKPKQITWSLDKDGLEYKKVEDEFENNFERYLTNDALENLKTMKEDFQQELKIKKEDVFELYLTDSGIPWIQTKKPESITEANNQTVNNSKFSNEEIKHANKTNFATVQSIQEALELKSKIMKTTNNKLEYKVPALQHCSFTPQELAREKQADREVCRRLKEIIESKFKIDNKVLLSHFFDSKKGVQYYINRYNNEHKFKEWFDSTFPKYTIKEALQIAIPNALKSKEKDAMDPNNDLQNYIDIYKNDPIYKEWFDSKYPGQTIYEIIGIPETQLNKNLL